jgi:hypothetical protein
MPFSKTEKDRVGKHMQGEKQEQEKVSHKGRKGGLGVYFKAL